MKEIMNTKNILLTAAMLLNTNSHAMFGQDTALLVQLVTTTASQLNELEKLLSNAEKYTQRIQQYNELFQDEYYKSERIKYLAEEVVRKKEANDLGDLNFAIRDLKYSMSELKALMAEYAKVKSSADKAHKITKIQMVLNKKKRNRAKIQVAHSIKASNTGRSTQLTAQNTALIYETQLEMEKNQRDIVNHVSTTNKLLSESLEDKRLEEITKRKRYNLGSSK
jgi:hypothetical protein